MSFTILWQLNEGVQDVPYAKKRIQESLQWIHKAIAVNPQAHFGREIWQAVLEEFLLAALDNPEVLLRYEMVGNKLLHDVTQQLAGRASDGCCSSVACASG